MPRPQPRVAEPLGRTAGTDRLLDRWSPPGAEVTPRRRLTVLGALHSKTRAPESRLRPQGVDTYRVVWPEYVEPALKSTSMRK
jgi:hypothetical protein